MNTSQTDAANAGRHAVPPWRVKALQWLAMLLLLAGLAVPGAARADALDSIIDIVLTAVDPSLAQARPLVKCLASGKSAAVCAQETAQQEASSAVSGMMASDPKITLVVDIVTAANGGDWLRVLELTGTDLLTQVACAAGMPGGGPVKGFICSGLFSQVAGLAKPVVREILAAIRDKDWLRLVTLGGPDLACQVIPGGDALKDTVCSVLGEILGAAAEAVGDAAGAVWGQIQEWTEDIQGQSAHMSYDKYYSLYLKHLIQKRALQRIVHGRQGLGLDSGEWNTCVDYFDSHKQARDTAKKTCTDLGNRLHNESTVFATYAESVPQTYFDTRLKPDLADLVAEHYWGQEVEDFQKAMFALQPAQWELGAFPSSQAVFYKDYLKCFGAMPKMLFGDSQYMAYPGLQPTSLREWACYQAAGLKYSKALVAEKLRLILSVKPKMASAGCQLEAQGSSKSVVYKCASFDGYLTCREAFDGYRYSHCRIDKIAADTSLGTKLAGVLGAKRCTFVATSKEGYHDPKVLCTRPWKHSQCEQLLAQELQSPVLQDHPFTQATVQCKYYLEPAFKQGMEKAEAILAALNAPPAARAEAEPEPEAAPEAAAGTEGSAGLGIRRKLDIKAKTALKAQPVLKAESALKAKLRLPANCAATWDPLALDCRDGSVLKDLPARLPGVTLPICPPDPGKDGADVPCYSGPYPIDLADQGGAIGRVAPDAGEDGRARLSGRAIGGLALAELPDQVARPEFILAGRTVQWNGTVVLDAGTLPGTPGQGCLAVADYGVLNQGKAMSPAASQDRWSVAGRAPDARGSVGRIPPGGERRQQVSLTLYPGDNQVTLTLDPDGRIPESDEDNNVSRVTVRLTGNCLAGVSRRPAGRETATDSGLPALPAPAQAVLAPGLTGTASGEAGKPLPDLLPVGMVRIGGATGMWNGGLGLDAGDMRAVKSGEACNFPMDFTIQNVGERDSGPFRAAVTNTAVAGPGWQPMLRSLPARGSHTVSGNVTLRPGRNLLQVVVDDLGQVTEASEANNRASLNVNLSGSCAVFSPAPPPLPPAGAPAQPRLPGLLKR